MAEKKVIDKDQPLNPGDVIEMEFATAGMVWITATQIALIEWKLANRKDFTILNHSLPSNNRVIFKIEVKQKELQADPNEPEIYEAVVLSGSVIAGLITTAAIGALFLLTLREIRLIIESPAGDKVVTGLSTMSVAAIIAIIMLLLGNK